MLPCDASYAARMDAEMAPVYCVTSIKIHGFKSYAGSVEVRGLEDFTCIIGANGAGKSVMGDAIAFVLGSASGMRRTQLMKLVNDNLKQGSASNCEAQVTLMFQRGQAVFRCGRRLTVAGRCEPILCSGEMQEWQPIKEEVFSEHLRAHGIEHDSLRRCFVKQQDQAVKVHDPLVLAEHFEVLIGTSGYVSRIAQTRQVLSDQIKTCEDLQAIVDRTERRRSEISPEVRKCKAYREHERSHQIHKRSFLARKREHLQAEVATLQKEDEHAFKLLSRAEELAKLAAVEKADAQRPIKAAKRDLDAQTAAEQTASDQVNTLMLERSRCEVRLKGAKADTKASGVKARRAAKRLAELTSKEAAARRNLETIDEGIESLRDEKTKQQAALDALQISREDKSSLMDLQAHARHARAQMEPLEASRANKQRQLASILDSISSSSSRHDESRSRVDLLNAQEAQDEERKASAQAKLTAMQQDIQQKELEHEALQAKHLQAQVGCQCLRDSIGDADSGKDSGRFARFDGACLRLSEMSKAGKLPGTFFGRICNVAHVSGLDAAAAVSAVAKEAINLATTFVVGNRKCAEHVLEYLGRNQIGVATCLIAEEMPSSNARASSFADSLEGLVSVGANAELQGVVTKLFGTWHLVNTRSEAIAYLDSARRRKHQRLNIVTRQGELFKADGEVVSSGRPAGATGKYELAAYPKPILSPPEVVVSTSSGETGALKQRLAEAVQLEKTLCRQVEGAAASMRMMRGELARETAALEAQTRGAASQAKQAEVRIACDRVTRESGALQKLEGQLTTMQAALAAEEEQHRLCQKACEAAEAAYGQACCRTPGGQAFLQAQQGLQACVSQLLQAEAERRQAELELKRARSQTAAVQKAIADMDTKASSAKGVGELTQLLKSLKRQLTGAEICLAEADKARHAKQRTVKAAQCVSDEADRKASKVELERASREKALQASKGRLAASRSDLQDVERALKTPEDGGEDMDLGEHSERGNPTAGERAKKRSVLVVPSESDEEDAPEEALQPCRAELDALEEELAAEEDRLQDMKEEVRLEVLEEDDGLVADVLQKLSELTGFQNERARLEAELGALEEQRYVRFAAAVKDTNVQLSAIFRRLSGQRGDVYCSHADDTRLAFAQGLEFHVRPDNRAWRPFPALSGGQQALATLALSFALQAAYPSPLYFFDEIDCMLDSTTAARVAEYIRSQARSQYIVVSHKPQVYEKARCLIGVYTCNGSSQAVTLSCEE